MDNTPQSTNVIGNHTVVRFPALGNVEVSGKVDTGATTSSLHATNIKVNGHQVSFMSDISPNIITTKIDGAQTVHTADNGGEDRPIIKLDIEINGVAINGATFNLNDRSNMDSKILLGQNVLQAGNFIVDVNKDSEEPPVDSAAPTEAPLPESVDDQEKIMEAIRILADANVSLMDIVKYLRTEAVGNIQE